LLASRANSVSRQFWIRASSHFVKGWKSAGSKASMPDLICSNVCTKNKEPISHALTSFCRRIGDLSHFTSLKWLPAIWPKKSKL
jgi:hypothetical protein